MTAPALQKAENASDSGTVRDMLRADQELKELHGYITAALHRGTFSSRKRQAQAVHACVRQRLLPRSALQAVAHSQNAIPLPPAWRAHSSQKLLARSCDSLSPGDMRTCTVQRSSSVRYTSGKLDVQTAIIAVVWISFPAANGFVKPLGFWAGA